jgi:hypothetical protein
LMKSLAFAGEITCASPLGYNVSPGENHQCLNIMNWVQSKIQLQSLGEVYTKMYNINPTDVPGHALCPSGVHYIFNIRRVSAYFSCRKHYNASLGYVLSLILKGDSGFIYVDEDRTCRLFPMHAINLNANPSIRCTLIDLFVYDSPVDSYFEKHGYRLAESSARFSRQRTEEIAKEVRNLSLNQVVKDLGDNGDSWTSKIIEQYVENLSAEMTLHELCKILHEWGNDYARPASYLARIHLSAIMRIRDRSGVGNGTVASVFEALSETRELFKFVRR